MKKIQPNENEFSKWFRANFDGWIERVEPAMGMAPGFADLVALFPSGLIPIELKIGSISDGVLWTSEVRPAQISWHHKLGMFGGTSFFAVGVWTGNQWDVYAFDGFDAMQWETTGFEIGKHAFKIDSSNLFDNLNQYIFEQLDNRS